MRYFVKYLSRKWPLLIGCSLAALTIAIHSLLTPQKQLEITSFLLVLIASVYYGFALSGHHKKAAIIESIVASCFVLLGLFGLWFSPWILVGGLLLHGVWDLLHHNTGKLVKIPAWYIPFCASYDIIMALYLALLHSI